MIHVAPPQLYEVLQKDLDWAIKHNYQIFFERVKKDPVTRMLTRNQEKIKKFLSLLLGLYPVLAARFGIATQKEKIAYPEDAINADITLDELVEKLDENGFRCDFLLWFFANLDEAVKAEVKKKLSTPRSFNAAMDNSEKRSLNKLVGWFFFRKAIPIILDYRNGVAVAKIRENSDGRNIFIHYGEKHIKGLVGLLEKDGWVVKETTYTDLADFC